MPDKVLAHHAGERIAALAAAQHGVVSAAQLYALGLSRDQVGRRVRAGWLHRVHRGVYAVGNPRLFPPGRWLAATLAAGPSAVLSHGSAAALWKILDPYKSGWGRQEAGQQGTIHVTLPGAGSLPNREGLIVHRSSSLSEQERTTHRGIPVTSPARTILDIATEGGGRPLERAVDESERLRLCSSEDLAEVLDAHSGEQGAGELRRVLRSHEPGSTATRSELEERFLALCRRHRLPQPAVNAPLHGLTVDFLWRSAKLVVEVDGRGSHDTRRGFEDDRDRDSLLAAHGYLTLRFTWRDVTARPAVVAHRLRRVLAARAR